MSESWDSTKLPFHPVTVRQTKAVSCSECGAVPGRRCGPVKGYTTGTHKKRIEYAVRISRARPRWTGADLVLKGQIGQ